jgi:L-iditol 2-dehydrogenase
MTKGLMRAAVYYANDDVRIENLTIPKIGSGELLVRVQACGICGSDVMQWYRIHKVPLVLGHEMAGIIVSAPGGLDYKEGDRISASHHVPCGSCSYCLEGHETVCETLRKTNFDPGGFCQFLRLPAINVQKQGVYRLPDGVSFDEATFVEPVACVLRAQRLAGLKKGQCVLIFGCGVAGLLHLQVARIKGARPIAVVDIVDFRLQTARDLGADFILKADEDIILKLRQINQGRLADMIVLCTGAESALSLALKSVERSGTILFFAPTEPGFSLPLPVNELFWRNEITLISSYAGTPNDHREALELISSRCLRLEEMITHRLSLDQTGLGFRLVAQAQDSLKVIVYPNKN